MIPLSQAVSLADAIAARLGRLDRPIDIPSLIAAAQRRARHQDFGDCDFREPLARFLQACAGEARLGVFGRLATRQDVIRFLVNLLRLRHAEARDPSITDEIIQRPIFITGLPRTGTSFLGRLLMQDSANESPRVYQTVHPYRIDAAPADRRVAIVNRQLRIFARLAPEFPSLHPLDATSPQECSEITAHVFASLRFDSNYDIPSYRTWLDAHGHQAAYRFHRRFLRHLQHQAGPRRWILKCPDHIFALDAIRATYPDARMVFVHRDPVKVLASVARLTEVIRRPFTRTIDRAALGRQESARWLDGTGRMIRATETQDFAEPICHIRHTDLVADPLQTIAAIYRHFALPLTVDTIERIRTLTAQAPNGGYGVHRYHLADHGLDADTERRKFAPYMAKFAIPPEAAAARPPDRPATNAPAAARHLGATADHPRP